MKLFIFKNKKKDRRIGYRVRVSFLKINLIPNIFDKTDNDNNNKNY